MAKYITISSSFHPTICTERARDLAMEILKTRSKKSGGDSEVRKRLQGLEATSKEGMKMETPRIISNYYSSDGRSNTFERRKCPSTKTTKVSLNEDDESVPQRGPGQRRFRPLCSRNHEEARQEGDCPRRAFSRKRKPHQRPASATLPRKRETQRKGKMEKGKGGTTQALALPIYTKIMSQKQR